MILRLLSFLVAAILVASNTGFGADALDLKIVNAERVSDGRNPAVALLNLRLDESSRREFALWTSRHLNEKVDIVVNGKVIMQPRLLTAITGGGIQIVGASADEIDALIPRLLDGRSALSVSNGH